MQYLIRICFYNMAMGCKVAVSVAIILECYRIVN